METQISKTGPTINKGKSKQDYSTPKDFVEAVVNRFGRLTFDLAASPENSLVARVEECKNHFDINDNSLLKNWDHGGHLGFGNYWLNPPFSDITPWAKKCSETLLKDNGRILFLVPASVGSEWYAKYVHPFAYVLALSPRLTFVGCKDPYPRDCILAVYGNGFRGFDTWRWK